MRSSQQSTPVKLTNAKLKVGRNGDVEITTNRSTNLEVSNAKINFKKQIFRVSKEHESAKLDTLTTENMIATIEVKLVGFIDHKKETINTRYGPKLIRKAIVADETKSMKISFWNDTSDDLTAGESYSITALVVKSFEGALVLNTTADTTSKPISPIANVISGVKTLLAEKIQNVYIQQIHISDIRCCQACHHKMEANAEDKTVRCSACQTKQRSAELKRTLTASLTVKDEQNNISKFYVAQHVLMEFLQSCSKENLIGDVDQLEDFLLEINNVKITHGSSNDAITKMEKTE
ncbi:uncharacterized protein LOC111113563 [Crassostrea virginica]